MHPSTARKQSIVDRLSGKESKQAVNYRPSGELDTKSSCAECEYYCYPGQPSSSCDKVAGVVDGSCVCDMFGPRASEHGQQGQGVSLSLSLNVQPPNHGAQH